MNNFTKSIVYSGVVLAAGLVAIFAIYNNMGTDTNVSYIEPAAGTEAAEGITQGLTDITTSVQEAAADATEAAGDMAEKAGDMAKDAADATAETA